MTDFTEDPIYLPKDTKVFIICDPNDMYSMEGKKRVEHEFRVFGYDNISIQYYVTLDQINDSVRKLGIDLPVRKETMGIAGVYEWYTFANVLKKARILENMFIVAFSSSSLTKDIPRRIRRLDSTWYHDKDIAVLNNFGAQDILDKAQNFNIIRKMTQKPPREIIRSFRPTT